MAYQAIPAFITLILKLFLLGYAVRSPRRHPITRLFVFLLGLFALHNVVEVFGMSYFAHHGLDTTMTRYGYAYFVFGILFIAVLLHLSLRLSIGAWDVIRPYVPLLYVPALILEYLLLGTDKLVAGFQLFNEITILRVPGPLYFLFETYATTYLVAAMGYVIYGARPGRAPIADRIRNRWWLAALLPFVALNAYLILANHFGLAKLPSTMTIPVALTLFLAITTYAMHQHRLFEITFFLPWSPARRRTTAFYRRMQSTLAELLELRSVHDILQRLAELMGCSIALVGGTRPVFAHAGTQPDAGQTANLTGFPPTALARIDRITVASEIAATEPETYKLMREHGLAAIVPFRLDKHAATRWMLLTDHFADNVYTPLDFEAVERVLNQIGERFVDRVSQLRAQLTETRQDLRDYQRRLTEAWAAQTTLQRQLDEAKAENKELRARTKTLLHEQHVAAATTVAPPEKALAALLADFEARIISETLTACGGNRSEAARILGLRPNTLHYKMRRLDIH
jgi:DNA-binding protein Fis